MNRGLWSILSLLLFKIAVAGVQISDRISMAEGLNLLCDRIGQEKVNQILRETDLIAMRWRELRAFIYFSDAIQGKEKTNRQLLELNRKSPEEMAAFLFQKVGKDFYKFFSDYLSLVSPENARKLIANAYPASFQNLWMEEVAELLKPYLRDEALPILKQGIKELFEWRYSVNPLDMQQMRLELLERYLGKEGVAKKISRDPEKFFKEYYYDVLAVARLSDYLDPENTKERLSKYIISGSDHLGAVLAKAGSPRERSILRELVWDLSKVSTPGEIEKCLLEKGEFYSIQRIEKLTPLLEEPLQKKLNLDEDSRLEACREFLAMENLKEVSDATLAKLFLIFQTRYHHPVGRAALQLLERFYPSRYRELQEKSLSGAPLNPLEHTCFQFFLRISSKGKT